MEKVSPLLSSRSEEVVLSTQGSPGAGWQWWGRRTCGELWGGQCWPVL